MLRVPMFSAVKVPQVLGTQFSFTFETAESERVIN
jgi:hypothetical protein